MLFGALIQSARVIRYDTQLGMLRLIDMTIVKFMLSTIVSGMIGIYLLSDMGLAELRIKPALLGGNVLGGVLFGFGWGLLGYCPATSVAALAEGRTDAFWGILGLVTGAGLYAEAYPLLSRTVLTWGNLGVVTVPDLLGLNHWVVIAAFVGCAVFFFKWLQQKGF